ncbi:LuxR C-terminal-related transcriptional regulator [Brevibacillus brevis]|uniref:LuxR C-terminal-related transcriptional regulator n=1 Tax=Brevibacillus brevis TaxID=1393 RepID=A0ABY9TBQ2_BREBE|nr:LuxR C-terminal-related transcriptional regulator [Brevibacillus brevis]WNC17535.1 LuxR C-terminal-related transcriptional regulator [Brevibacillus brevis]
MISQAEMQIHVRRLEGLSSHELKLESIVKSFIDIFPVSNALLFRYSPFDFIAEGIISMDVTGIDHIRGIRDDVRSIPGIYQAIRERKARYISKHTYLQEMNRRYATPQNSLLVAPIFFGSTVVGYIVSTRFVENRPVTEDLLASCTLFGKMVGRVMETSGPPERSIQLSRRELEVMQRVANGASLKEMAQAMEISELTVKQYVKTAIQKLGAHNRAQAVAELFRKGILS